MIKDNLITYAAASSPLLSFEFSSITLTSFIIALLTTILSYQATVILYDFFLGFKPPGVALVRNLHTLLLSRQSAPFAVLDAVVRKDCITRRRLRLPPTSFVSRHEEKILPHVPFKLLFLLLVAPICSVLSIAITLENETDLTFSQAGFGGLALDANPDLSVVETTPFLDRCHRAKYANSKDIVSGTDFFLCHTTSARVATSLLGLSDLQDVAIVDVRYIEEQDINIVVSVKGSIYQRFITASVRTPEGLLMLRTGNNTEAARRIATKGINLLATECGLENANAAEELPPFKSESQNGIGSLERHFGYKIHCLGAADPEISAEKVNHVVGQFPTFVNAERFHLTNLSGIALGDSPVFTDGSRRRFLTRRTRYISLPILAIITATSVLLRLIVKIICHDDLVDGLEKLVKDRLGLDDHHSLMRDGWRRVYYHTEKCSGGVPVEIIQTTS